MTTGALQLLDESGLRRMDSLNAPALACLADHFRADYPQAYQHLGDAALATCRDDLQFHLEFLRPVLAFGLLAPMVDYLRWLESVLHARALPGGALARSLDVLATFFATHLCARDAEIVTAALRAARDAFLATAAGPVVYPAPSA